VADVTMDGNVPALYISDDGEGQSVKSLAAVRVVPIHRELIRLGFLRYADSVSGPSLWPRLPQRAGKPGGFFSQYFGQLRRELGIPAQTVFHSFRHSVRTKLAEASVAEPTIDRILGHSVGGSVGARVYTRIATATLHGAIDSLEYPAIQLTPNPKLQRPPSAGLEGGHRGNRRNDETSEATKID
jgi:integrase